MSSSFRRRLIVPVVFLLCVCMRACRSVFSKEQYCSGAIQTHRQCDRFSFMRTRKGNVSLRAWDTEVMNEQVPLILFLRGRWWEEVNIAENPDRKSLKGKHNPLLTFKGAITVVKGYDEEPTCVQGRRGRTHIHVACTCCLLYQGLVEDSILIGQLCFKGACNFNRWPNVNMTTQKQYAQS